MPRGKHYEWREPSVIELAWLAGLLEGEGCFMATRKGRNKAANVEVTVKMTDRDVIEHVAAVWNAGVYLEPPPHGLSKKQAYSTCLTGKRARRMMSLLCPYMGARRRAKIETLLAGGE